MIFGHAMSIHLFIPTKKPTSRMLLQVVGYQLWAQMGSNHRPPDYESPLFDIIHFKKIGLFELSSTYTVFYAFTPV